MTASRGLTATQLKYFAAVFMVIDHIGMIFAPLAPLFPADSPWRWVLGYLPAFRYPGRLAFPIFAYFAAQGCRLTSNYRRYLLRLGLFGAVTHAVAYGATGGGGGSVIATFFLSAAAIGACRALRARGHGWLGVPVTIALLVLAQLLRVDYGWIGVLTVLAVYAAGTDRRRQLLALAACLLLCYLPSSPLMAGFACLALLPLSLYNGQRGKGSRWFFYWFYPGHLAALYALSMLIG